MTNIYPKHISEPIRIKIATSYIKQDLRKRLPNTRGKAIWEAIDNDIGKWFKTLGPRDFWNGFWGISMGFKLKLSLTQILTAENIVWKLENALPIDNGLISGGGYGYISKKLNKKLTAREISDFFKKNPKLANKWRGKFAKHRKASEPRDHFPIITLNTVGKDGETNYSMYDGNRRVVLALLEGKETIATYIGSYTTRKLKPTNYWLPTPFLMELVEEGEIISNYNNTLGLLTKLIELSESGKHELKERVLIGNNEFRAKLKKDLG
jgi:hypothetical protein